MRAGRVRAWVECGLLATAVGVFAWEMRELAPQADDAFISYRHARNLVEGHGLVFNVGERVEGFTNLLWTLFVAAGLALELRAEATAHVLGLASGIAALVLTHLYARTGLSSRRAWLAGLAPWVLLSAPAFGYWSASGLETPLVVASAAGALAAYERRRLGWATLAASVGVLTRPDGMLLGVVVFGLHVLRCRALRALIPGLVFAGVVLGLTLGRLTYYGSPLPNTFYAKVGGVPFEYGVDYVLTYLARGPGMLLVPAALSLTLPVGVAGAAFVALTAAYAASVGGDAFPLSRFLLPTLPALAVLALHGSVVAWKASRPAGLVIGSALPATLLFHWGGVGYRSAALGCLALGLLTALVVRKPVSVRWVAAGAATLAAALVVLFRTAPIGYAGVPMPVGNSSRADEIAALRRFDTGVALRNARMVKALRERARTRPVRLVAAVAVGQLGYRSRLPILDIVGIVDPVVARTPLGPDRVLLLLPGHHRSNADYVLERRPDVIYDLQTERQLQAVHDLMKHPRFAREYVYDRHLQGHRRRDAGQAARQR